jgi:hypothetical protein
MCDEDGVMEYIFLLLLQIRCTLHTHQLHKTGWWLLIRQVKSNVTLGIKLIPLHGSVIITRITHTHTHRETQPPPPPNHHPLRFSLTAVRSQWPSSSHNAGQTRLDHSHSYFVGGIYSTQVLLSASVIAQN